MNECIYILRFNIVSCDCETSSLLCHLKFTKITKISQYLKDVGDEKRVYRNAVH